MCKGQILSVKLLRWECRDGSCDGDDGDDDGGGNNNDDPCFAKDFC